MNLFGLTITKAANAARPVVQNRGGFFDKIKEPFTGAWQRNIEYTNESVLSNPTLFRCVHLISSDIGKLGLQLSSVDSDGVWTASKSNAFSPVLKKPNPFQTRQQFLEHWVHSKLTSGNTYVLKVYDARSVVTALYILDPTRVTPLVSPSGEVFYDLRHDDLSRVEEQGRIVPASAIIHDRFNCLHHPLIGLSPISAAGLAAFHGLEIASTSAVFFKNGAQPSGILSAPGEISEESASSIKQWWQENFAGNNRGSIAVVADGITYQPLAASAVDSQLVEQLKWTEQTIASVFGIPAFILGVGELPVHSNTTILNQQYYSQCLQPYLNAIEDLLDEGLALPEPYHCEFNLDDLIRLDEQALVDTLKEGVGAGIISPNEARLRLNYRPVKGGDEPLIQQQNYSLSALAERDADKPFAKPVPANNNEQLNNSENEEDTEKETSKALNTIMKGLSNVQW